MQYGIRKFTQANPHNALKLVLNTQADAHRMGKGQPLAQQTFLTAGQDQRK